MGNLYRAAAIIADSDNGSGLIARSAGLPAWLAAPAPAAAAAAAVSTAAAAAGARRLRARFIHRETTAAEGPIVQLRHGSLGGFVGGHLDKGEPARAACFAVPADVHGLDGAGLGQQL